MRRYVCHCSLRRPGHFIEYFSQEMKRLRDVIDDFNTRLYNPVGLNILWPQKVAFMFVRVLPSLPFIIV